MLIYLRYYLLAFIFDSVQYLLMLLILMANISYILQQEQFREYYDFVMPYLKTIRVNANDKSNHKLQVRAFECISLVALAVGKEKFRDDLELVFSQQYMPITSFCMCV